MSVKSKLKKLFASRFVRWLYNHLPLNNKKGKRGNKLQTNGVLKKCKIVFQGKGNSVIIEKGVVLKHCSIVLTGNDNRVVFKEKSYGKFADLCLQDNGNYIEVGEKSGFAGKIHLACIEGTKIVIGQDCLFSSEIVFRTGDSHVVVDLEGNRTNFSKDITIGNHVWMGHRVLVNKGVCVADTR